MVIYVLIIVSLIIYAALSVFFFQNEANIRKILHT